jgi:hypothetical protein
MRLQPLSLHQVLAGDPVSNLIKPKDLTKALGVTLTKAFNLSKAKAFIPDGDKHRVHSAVLAEFDRLHALLKEGQMPLTFATATMKDELYTEVKVLEGKARYFYVCDLAANMLMRMYVLPIMAHLLDCPFESEIIGVINPGSEAWAELARHLTTFGPDRIVDADQKAFDSHHSRALTDYALDMKLLALKLGYSSANAEMVVRVLRMAGRYGLFMEGNLYVCSSGLASGRADTLVANSIINKKLMYYCCRRAAQEAGLPPSGCDPVFQMRMACVGDDNATALHPDCPLSPEDIPRFQRELGYEVTDATKKAFPSFKRLEEIVFLKRRFVWRGKDCMAPLELASILKSIAYEVGAVKENPWERVGMACQSAIRELFMHDDVTEAKYRAVLERIVVEHHLPSLPTKLELRREYDLKVFTPWATNTYDVVKGNQSPELVAQLAAFAATIDPASDGSLNIVPQSGGAALPPQATGGEGRYRETLPLRIEKPRGALEGTSSANKQETSSLETAPSVAESNTLNLSSVGVAVGEVATVRMVEAVVGDLSSMSAGHSAPATATPLPYQGFEELLRRDRKVRSFPLGVLQTFQPSTSFFAIPQVASLVKPYRYVRYELDLTLVVTGTSAMYGLTRVVFYPRIPADDYSTTVIGQSTDSLLCGSIPHVDIDVSQPGSYKVRLPYIHNLPMIPMGNEMWDVNIIPIVTPSSVFGLTPPTVLVDVYAALVDPQFFVPVIPQGKEDDVPQGPISRMLRLGQQVAAASPIPYADVIAAAAGLGSTVAQRLGFSRPPVSPDTISVVRFTDSIAYMFGQPDFSQTLGSSPGQCRNVAVAAYPMASENDDDLAEICRIPFVIGVIGATIAVNISPSVGIYETLNTRWSISPMSHTALAFVFWRGTIKLRITIPSSPLVRMRVGINVFPPGQTSNTYVGDGTIIAYSLDVVGTTSIEVDVPWFYQEYLRPVPNLHLLNAGVDMPSVKWFILDGPFGPSATPITPRAIFEIMAGHDFELAVPSLNRTEFFSARYVAPGAFAEDLPYEPEGLAEALQGEEIRTVRQLAKRSGFMGAIAGTHPDGALRVTKSGRWTFDTWFRPCYYGYTGSSTWHATSSSPAILSARLVQRNGVLINDTARALAKLDLYDTSSVRAVDRSVYLFKAAKSEGVSATTGWILTLDMSPSGTGEMFQAAGDDRRYIKYLCPPAVFVLAP